MSQSPSAVSQRDESDDLQRTRWKRGMCGTFGILSSLNYALSELVILVSFDQNNRVKCQSKEPATLRVSTPKVSFY